MVDVAAAAAAAAVPSVTVMLLLSSFEGERTVSGFSSAGSSCPPTLRNFVSKADGLRLSMLRMAS